MSNLHSWLKDLLPPIALRMLRHLRSGSGIHFEGNYANWDEAAANCSGYNADHILAKVLDATLKVKRGEAEFERDSVLLDEIEYAWPVLAGLMWAAARSGGVLNVLDFGGALGSSYFQNRKFLQTLPEVHWSVVEQSHYVAAGQAHIQDGQLRFYATIDDCLTARKPNVILLSSVLQYLPNPYETLDELIATGSDTLLIDRTSVLRSGDKDLIRIQHVPKSIYMASYPCRAFSDIGLRDFITLRKYRLVEEFNSLDKFDPYADWRGFVYEKRK